MRFLALFLLYIGSFSLSWAGESIPVRDWVSVEQISDPSSITTPISPIEPQYKKPIKPRWWKKSKARPRRHSSELSPIWYLGMHLASYLGGFVFAVAIFALVLALEEIMWITASLLFLLFLIYSALLFQTWLQKEALGEETDEFWDLMRIAFGYIAAISLVVVWLLFFWYSGFSISWVTSDNAFYAITALYALIFSSPFIFFAIYDHIKTY